MADLLAQLCKPDLKQGFQFGLVETDRCTTHSSLPRILIKGHFLSQTLIAWSWLRVSETVRA